MRISTFFIGLTFIFISLIACSDQTEPINNPAPEGEVFDPNVWDVPRDDVFDGGPGKDGIPSIDDPSFSTKDDLDIVNKYNDLLVTGIVHNGQARAYPHPILDWHEIVNDDIDDLSVAITFCPLTGTGIGWDRVVNEVKTEFGVSGLLYDTNLMPYDRATESTWSQQRLNCVNGRNRGREINVIPLMETTLRTWLEAYPDSEILNEDTGFNRNYGVYPYGDYRTNNDRILFPISNNDTRLPGKERVLGVFVGKAVIGYRFDQNSTQTEVIQENFRGASIIVVRNKRRNFIVAFENTNELQFEASQDFPAVLKDENGNIYDISGQLIDGEGSHLQQMKSFIGYWFSWGTFYPDMEISEMESR